MNRLLHRKSLLILIISASWLSGVTLAVESKVNAPVAVTTEIDKDPARGAAQTQAAVAGPTEVQSTDVGQSGIFSRAWDAGFVAFLTLLLLIGASIGCWVIIITKWKELETIRSATDGFIKAFWDSRSLNDLNGRLQEYPYSPTREVFRSGYAELARSNQMRENTPSTELAISAAMDNLNRSLQKAKLLERKTLERNMNWLAIIASVSPFVGLFGTVWGIMNSFEGIARSGSASLAAVAPGIAEALTATAFGLGAAIPAVIGYNLFNGRLRFQMMAIDGFCSDFLNIVERYLVTEKSKAPEKV
jgi:biopolymer transport protein TolQ